MSKLTLLLLSALILTACEKFALLSTAEKKPSTQKTALSEQAEKVFWGSLHAGNYAEIPEATRLMTAAFLENPNNPQLAAHLGFLHIWKITEHNRLAGNDPRIVDEILLSKAYFAEAIKLNPLDARYQGFYGDTLLITGKIFHDQREQVKGYFQLKRAITMWPQFNYFTAGYPFSILNPHLSQYQEGLTWQWKTLDLCAGEKVNRIFPDYRKYLSRETQIGPMRACWNSWTAPHNFEGFFLNMGDMLVKAGQWQTGQRIYQNAKLSKSYAFWPLKNLLEKRILNARQNVRDFNQEKSKSPDHTVLFNSGYGCVVCHQVK